MAENQEMYYSTKTATGSYQNPTYNYVITSSASFEASSHISQEDADNIALQNATSLANSYAIHDSNVSQVAVNYILNNSLGGAGSTGPTGPQGPAGGPTGPQGNVGIQGPVGPSGIQGIQGPTGPQGSGGTVGSQGPGGSQGPQGPTGPQGERGIQGIGGGQGPQGPTGPQGIQGQINYIYSVNNESDLPNTFGSGNIGTPYFVTSTQALYIYTNTPNTWAKFTSTGYTPP